MTNLLKTVWLSIFAFALSPLVAQPPPPPPGPTPDIGTLGTFAPRAITGNDNFMWSTVNNTNCPAYFINYFQVLEYEGQGGPVSNIKIFQAGMNGQPLFVPPGASGGVTNLQLVNMWGLDLGKYYEISAMGVWISFGGMMGYTALYPAGSGGKIYTGQPSPCDCFRYYFEPAGNGFQLRLEPVLAPETCP